MPHSLRRVFAGLLLAMAAAAVAPQAQAVAKPTCVGAAARDPARPCAVVPDRFKASPSPSMAPLVPNAACTPIRPQQRPNTCWFGRSAKTAKATVALVGDSHAPAWRAALAVVARGQRWRGITIRRNSCPFSFAEHPATDTKRDACSAWVRQTVKWFKDRPTVKTAFVTSSAAYAMVAAAGGDPFAAAVAGFRASFAALPASVTSIVVLRDSPRAEIGTLDCIERALKQRQRPDLRCTVPRSEALRPDPAVQAAIELNSPRVQVIDLTPFFCDEAVCQTVIGGLTVHKDTSHLSAPFSATLGPFLLAAYENLVASAGPLAR